MNSPRSSRSNLQFHLTAVAFFGLAIWFLWMAWLPINEYTRTGCDSPNYNNRVHIPHCSSPAAEIGLFISVVGWLLLGGSALVAAAWSRQHTLDLQAARRPSLIANLDSRFAGAFLKLIWCLGLLFVLGSAWLNFDIYRMTGCQRGWKNSFLYCESPMPEMILTFSTLASAVIVLLLGFFGWVFWLKPGAKSNSGS